MPAYKAGLIGDTVNCSQIAGGTFSCLPATAVVGAGSEFNLGSGFIDVDISDYSVDLSFPLSGSLGATIIVLDDFDWSIAGEMLTDVLLTSQSGITGFSLSNISFTTAAAFLVRRKVK